MGLVGNMRYDGIGRKHGHAVRWRIGKPFVDTTSNYVRPIRIGIDIQNLHQRQAEGGVHAGRSDIAKFTGSSWGSDNTTPKTVLFVLPPEPLDAGDQESE